MANASGQSISGVAANLKVTSLTTLSSITSGNMVTAVRYASNLLYSAAGTPLPAASSALNGQTAIVSDATSPTYMGAYASGGPITCQVICSFNGTTYAWYTK